MTKFEIKSYLAMKFLSSFRNIFVKRKKGAKNSKKIFYVVRHFCGMEKAPKIFKSILMFKVKILITKKLFANIKRQPTAHLIWICKILTWQKTYKKFLLFNFLKVLEHRLIFVLKINGIRRSQSFEFWIMCEFHFIKNFFRVRIYFEKNFLG